MRWTGHVAGVVNKKIQDIGGKAKRKETAGWILLKWVSKK
jgi:hypothetical protein